MFIQSIRPIKRQLNRSETKDRFTPILKANGEEIKEKIDPGALFFEPFLKRTRTELQIEGIFIRVRSNIILEQSTKFCIENKEDNLSLLKKLLELYPKILSDNSILNLWKSLFYISLGRIYGKMGKYKLAIDNYKKSFDGVMSEENYIERDKNYYEFEETIDRYKPELSLVAMDCIKFSSLLKDKKDLNLFISNLFVFHTLPGSKTESSEEKTSSHIFNFLLGMEEIDFDWLKENSETLQRCIKVIERKKRKDFLLEKEREIRKNRKDFSVKRCKSFIKDLLSIKPPGDDVLFGDIFLVSTYWELLGCLYLNSFEYKKSFDCISLCINSRREDLLATTLVSTYVELCFCGFALYQTEEKDKEKWKKVSIDSYSSLIKLKDKKNQNGKICSEIHKEHWNFLLKHHPKLEDIHSWMLEISQEYRDYNKSEEVETKSDKKIKSSLKELIPFELSQEEIDKKEKERLLAIEKLKEKEIEHSLSVPIVEKKDLQKGFNRANKKIKKKKKSVIRETFSLIDKEISEKKTYLKPSPLPSKEKNYYKEKTDEKSLKPLRELVVPIPLPVKRKNSESRKKNKISLEEFNKIE